MDENKVDKKIMLTKPSTREHFLNNTFHVIPFLDLWNDCEGNIERSQILHLVSCIVIIKIFYEYSILALMNQY